MRLLLLEPFCSINTGTVIAVYVRMIVIHLMRARAGLLFDGKEFVLIKEGLLPSMIFLKLFLRACLILKWLGVLWGTVK